jgi:hypothetical protein
VPIQQVQAPPEVGTPAFFAWLSTCTGPLPRSIFSSQAQWHRMVAYRALIASGHAFDIEGSCFDLRPSASQKAPQCTRCFSTFAVAKIHVLAKDAVQCAGLAVSLATPLVVPQRLRPSRDYQLFGSYVHASHQLGHFRGRVWCYACASTFAVTSSRLPKALREACNERNVEQTALRNLAFLAAGELPPAWRAGGWPKGSDFGLLGFL